MMDHEPLQTFNSHRVEQMARCSETAGRRGRTPRATLDRWIAAAEGIEEALRRDDVDAAITDFTRYFDPLQAEIVSHDIRTGFRLLESDRERLTFEPDEPDSELAFDLPNALVTSRRTLAIRTDGETEYVKIRTGKNQTSPTEAAILIAGGEPASRYSDLMLRYETFEDIELSETALEEQLKAIRRTVEMPATKRNAGFWCYMCSRYGSCGQYPTLDGVRVKSSDRSIFLTVTDLSNLAQCSRRVAWKRLFAIPEDAAPEPGAAQVLGITFHELIAAAIVADDPPAVFEAGLRTVAPSEHAALRRFFDRHAEISQAHPSIEYRLAEFQFGFTETVSGMDNDRYGNVLPDQPVLVTLIVRADAVGREDGDLPVVVDHKTGQTAGTVDNTEMDAYAVATDRVTNADTTVVRFHALGLPDGPKVHRGEYDHEDIDLALEGLRSRMTTYASINPIDATAAPPSPGPWCARCSYSSRCSASTARTDS